MSDKYAKLHGIDCGCDLCAHVERQWGEVEQALAEARSRRKEPKKGTAEGKADPSLSADPDAASSPPGDEGGDER